MYFIRLSYESNDIYREVNFSCASYEKYMEADGGLTLIFFDDSGNNIKNVETWKHGYVNCYIMNGKGKTIDKHAG